MTFETIKNLFLQCKGIDFQIKKDIDTMEKSISNKKNRFDLMIEAQAFLQEIAQKTQSKLKLQIEDIVNLALETCFPNEYEFKIEFNIMRGKTEAELVFLSKLTGAKIDPMNASGGGVVDLTSFALRIACYTLQNNPNNVIILDEPFRFISRDLQSKAGEILKSLSEKLGLQIIMVTHIPELVNVADKVFEVKKIDGISKVISKKIM